MKKVYTLIALLSYTLGLFAQCMTIEIPLEERVEHSDFIVEGEIIAQKGFWDDRQQNIYTNNTIQIFKIFKGEVAQYATLELITRGGTVGTDMQVDHPSLQLRKGDKGLFLLRKNTIANNTSADQHRLYCVPTATNQGFIRYDVIKGKAFDPHKEYDGVTTELYALMQTNNVAYKEVTNFNFDKQSARYQQVTSKNLTSFTPSTITAGTGSILTINGSGFGNTAGMVRFADANNSSTALTREAVEIDSWTNTKIRVIVPSSAGTGKFHVETSSGSVFTSSSDLMIPYNITNITHEGKGFIPQLVNDNGKGGFTWQYHNDFASGADQAGAAEAFTRALGKWCGSTAVNWEIGENTSIDVAAKDEVNIVRFDNGSELPSGVLGRATSRFQGCYSASGLVWYVTEMDIVFNDRFNFHTSDSPAASPMTDLESVAIHELGHTHMMGHTRNGSSYMGDIMFRSIAAGTNKRDIQGNDYNAGMYVFTMSNASGVCSRGAMTASNCSHLNLPVELIAFNVEATPRENVLRWTTASELNNAGFYVQRSKDALNWETLDFVKGNGTTLLERNYKYYDAQPFLGVSYYRLKQVDTNDTFEYTDVLSIQRKSDIKDQKDLIVFPNPASTRLTLQMENQDLSGYQLELMDAFGRVVRIWDNVEGYTYDLDLNGLSKGSYTLILRGEQVMFRRIMKQ